MHHIASQRGLFVHSMASFFTSYLTISHSNLFLALFSCGNRLTKNPRLQRSPCRSLAMVLSLSQRRVLRLPPSGCSTQVPQTCCRNLSVATVGSAIVPKAIADFSHCPERIKMPKKETTQQHILSHSELRMSSLPWVNMPNHVKLSNQIQIDSQ